MSNDVDLIASAQCWIDADPHRATQVLGQALLAENDIETIREHFGSRLSFGTAGLRGEMGPGPNRMNHATVRRAAYAFAQHLLNEDTHVLELGIVVGFDARHGSREFAIETARVFGALNIPSYLYDECQPTPVIAHAITHIGAAGGVIVTASHNPPKDNGYKVYWGNGAQIVPPHDERIGALIDSVVTTSEIEVADIEALRNKGVVRPVKPSVRSTYFDEIMNERVGEKNADLRVVYTAMHGVGYRTIREALTRAGYDDLHPVVEQVEPDPEFPTVAFPNPEEPGAMDLAIQCAHDVDADLVIANDPDADRLCVGLKESDGSIRLLSGNEVGILIGDELLRKKCVGGTDLVATTIVSSQLLSKLAEQYGADFEETLTGFKWLANAALEKEAHGGRFLFGFEEALGYSVGSVVRDKDGVSVAVVLCDLASELKAHDQTLLHRLKEIYLEHGVHVSAQHSIKLPGASGRVQIERMMADLRSNPPQAVGVLAVETIIDYQGKEVSRHGRTQHLPGSMPPSNVLAFYLNDGTRILARPSGTEPKIKFYFEVKVDLSPSQSLAEGEGNARVHLAAIQENFLQCLESINE